MSNVIKSVSITKPTAQTNNQEVNTMESDNSFYQVLLDNISSLNTRIRNVPMGYNSQSFVSDNSCESNSSYNDIADKNILSGVNNNISDVNNEFRVEVTASDSETKSRIINAVKDASIKYEVDANLILAVIKKESSFNPNATSRSGAMGLMQIMPKNTAYLGVKNAYNIEENIDGGTKLLKEYIDKYNGDIEMALMAYNGGPTRMAQRGVKSASDIYKMPKETQNYVPTVMKFYKGEE